MHATTVHDEDGLLDFAREGLIVPGTFFIHPLGYHWQVSGLAHEGHFLIIRLPQDGRAPKPAVLTQAQDLPYPLTFYTERPAERAEYGDSDLGGDAI